MAVNAVGDVLKETEMPTLGGAIFHVVTARSQEQMIWIATRRIVAAMQYLLTLWNLALVE